MCTIGIPHSDLHVERAGERDESGTVAVCPMLAHLGQVEIAHVGVHKMHVVALFVVISATTRARAALAVRPFTCDRDASVHTAEASVALCPVDAPHALAQECS